MCCALMLRPMCVFVDKMMTVAQQFVAFFSTKSPQVKLILLLSNGKNLHNLLMLLRLLFKDSFVLLVCM